MSRLNTTRSLLLGGVACLLMACEGQDPTTPVMPDPAKIYTSLRANHKAVVLSIHAPYDTVQLGAVPISLTGDTLPSTEPVSFTRLSVLDTSVSVDSSGMVTAKMGTSGTRVIARLTVGGITRADTITIMVRTENPVRPITRFEFSPLPPDSSWRWAGMRGSLNPQSWIRLYDAADSSIPASQAVVHIAAARNEVLSDLDFEYIAPTAKAVIGETYVYASVYAYGETFLDSTLFRRIDPPIRLIVVDRIFPANGEATVEFMPGMITAKAGTTVIFFNRFGYSEQHPSDFFDICLADYCGNQVRRSREYPQSTLVWVDSIDVVFENPAQVGAAATVGYMDFPGVWGGEFISDGGTGNIPPFGLMYCKTTGTGGDCGGRITPQTFSVNVVVETGVRGRKFTVPGTYHYTSTRFPNARGTIIITE